MGAPKGNRNAAGPKPGKKCSTGCSCGRHFSGCAPLGNRNAAGPHKFDYKPTSEHRSRVSARLRNNRNGVGNTGRSLTLEHRMKLSEAKIREWASGSRKPRYSGTLGEIALSRILNELGFACEEQYVASGVRGVWDAAIPSKLLLLEADGEWLHTLPDQIRRDSVKTRSAWAAGFKVLRFWRSELLDYPDLVRARLTEVLVC